MGLRFCISSKIPDAADAAGQRPHSESFGSRAVLSAKSDFFPLLPGESSQ